MSIEKAAAKLPRSWRRSSKASRLTTFVLCPTLFVSYAQ